MEPIAAPVHTDAEIETVMTLLGREPGGGLLGMPDNFMDIHRAPIMFLAARNSVPAVLSDIFVRNGGLLSYRADFADIFRRTLSYVVTVPQIDSPVRRRGDRVKRSSSRGAAATPSMSPRPKLSYMPLIKDIAASLMIALLHFLPVAPASRQARSPVAMSARSRLSAI
jgi:hypothetical protein